MNFVVGLTGGIGSGKTTVADFFAELGAAVVDTDAIAHELTGPRGAAIPQIAESFGPDVLRSDGSLDRTVMRQRCCRMHTDSQSLAMQALTIIATSSQSLVMAQ